MSGDPRVPWRPGAGLAPFVAAGVLTSADVHVARRLGTIADEDDERVLLAVALAVAALRAGSVCVALDAASTETVPIDAPATEPGPSEPGLSEPGLIEPSLIEPGATASSPTVDARELADVAGADAGAADEPDDDSGSPALPWPAPDPWHAAVRRSPLVADGPDGPADRPVRWVDGRVYLDRYWRDELVVRDEMHARLRPAHADAAALDAAVVRLFPSDADAHQREAVRIAATSHLTVLTGGPGTGKTTTVARLVAALQAAAGPGLRVALAAPTGKAAARLQESVNAEVARLADDDRATVGALAATTLHRLLGPRPGSTTRFRHDRAHRLPHDVVVVDESSMVSLPLMARLVEAVRPDARLVLVGDPDQLASVEAGAVLGDLVASLPAAVVELTKAHRYGADLGALAAAVRAGDAAGTLHLLHQGGPHITFTATGADVATAAETAALRTELVTAGTALVTAARAGDASAAIDALGRHRLLLAHREGLAGVSHWAALAESWISAATGAPLDTPWALGRPLLVTENDRASGLYNGDTGVVVRDLATPAEPGAEPSVVVAFGDASNPHLVAPHRLPAVQPVHAMTVHRGQGSQFAHVTVLLPPASSPLLTRELLYTAITRARESVHVIGTEDAVRAAVTRPVRRASGLRVPLYREPRPR